MLVYSGRDDEERNFVFFSNGGLICSILSFNINNCKNWIKYNSNLFEILLSY